LEGPAKVWVVDETFPIDGCALWSVVVVLEDVSIYIGTISEIAEAI